MGKASRTGAASKVDVWEKNIPGTGTGTCKCPEVARRRRVRVVSWGRKYGGGFEDIYGEPRFMSDWLVGGGCDLSLV